MSTLTIHSQTRALAKPEPRSPVSIRVASAAGAGADLRFIDDLQKKHSKMVGFLPFNQIERRIAQGTVLIAEEQVGEAARSIGYVIFQDQYLKREELGIVFQLNVASHKQRGLVGATLVKAAFERSAYGCKLFCCWCAQDIDANRFWESLGFMPLAFRAGSRGKEHGGTRAGGTRVHIFWQRRIREGDTETPYWFPSHTDAGALREGRIVLPIPPGTHWSEEMPMLLPGALPIDAAAALPESEHAKPRAKRERSPKPKPKMPSPNLPLSVTNGLRFGPPPQPEVVEDIPAPPKIKPKREKHRNDPRHVAAAREVRDRYLDEVNSGRVLLEGASKYDVSRQLSEAASISRSAGLLAA